MDDATFSITEKTFDKILNYAHHAKNEFQSEIGGMCVVLKDEDGDYELVDPVILKQTISGGNCDLDKDELAKYYTKTDLKYNKYDYSFCWWHSHHTLGAFWSGTDTSTMEEASGSNISYSLVVSWNKEEYGHIFRISLWRPYVDAKDIQLEITDRKEKRIPKAIMKEVEDKCSKPAAVSNYIGSPINSRVGNYFNSTSSYNYRRPGYQEPLFKEDPHATYGILLDLVDKLMNKLINGTIDYNGYSKEIDNMNDKLGKDNPLSVKKESPSKLDNILIGTAGDYVEYDLSQEDNKIAEMHGIQQIEEDWI